MITVQPEGGSITVQPEGGSITVQPEGGLCNRLRVVASSWLLAQALGAPMRVLWLRTPDFNARFDSLFETSALPFAVVEGTAMSAAGKALMRARPRLARLFGQVLLGDDQTAPGSFHLEAWLPRLRGRRVFIHTNSRLAFRPGMYGVFVPVAAATTRLAPLRPRLAGSVGVHVRRTDNTRAAAVSTLQAFMALMQAEAARAPQVEFFVATDEPEVLSQLRAAFGDRVWEFPKRAYARRDPRAIEDALVDLFALAACRKLIGSWWSSFTDTAAELSGIELQIARAEA